MKLGVGLLNVENWADSCENAWNPNRVRIFYPVWRCATGRHVIA